MCHGYFPPGQRNEENGHVHYEGGYFPPPWWVTIGVTLLGVAVLLVSGAVHG